MRQPLGSRSSCRVTSDLRMRPNSTAPSSEADSVRKVMAHGLRARGGRRTSGRSGRGDFSMMGGGMTFTAEAMAYLGAGESKPVTPLLLPLLR